MSKTFSKIKKPNKYCLGNQTKFSIFLRNNRDCMVVDPYKARNTRRKFLDSTRKFVLNQLSHRNKREQSKRVLRRNRKPLSKILASCFSKIKKPNKYCLENQTKFSIFLRNNSDCMVVDPYKARKSRSSRKQVLYEINFFTNKVLDILEK